MFATITLALTILYSVLLVAVAQGFLSALADTNLGDLINLVLPVGGVALNIGNAVAFLLWFRLCYRNLPALGAQELERSPRSAVLWWFVPFASFVVPLRVASEIWKGSEPSISPNTRPARAAATFPAALIPWWVAWCVTWLTRGVRNSSTDPGIFALFTLPFVAAAVMAIWVIWSIQSLQDRKAAVSE